MRSFLYEKIKNINYYDITIINPFNDYLFTR